MKVNAEESLAIAVILQALKDVCKSKNKRDVESARMFLTNKDDEWERHRDFISQTAGINSNWLVQKTGAFMQLSTSAQKAQLMKVSQELST